MVGRSVGRFTGRREPCFWRPSNPTIPCSGASRLPFPLVSSHLISPLSLSPWAEVSCCRRARSCCAVPSSGSFSIGLLDWWGVLSKTTRYTRTQRRDVTECRCHCLAWPDLNHTLLNKPVRGSKRTRMSHTLSFYTAEWQRQ